LSSAELTDHRLGAGGGLPHPPPAQTVGLVARLHLGQRAVHPAVTL